MERVVVAMVVVEDLLHIVVGDGTVGVEVGVTLGFNPMVKGLRNFSRALVTIVVAVVIGLVLAIALVRFVGTRTIMLYGVLKTLVPHSIGMVVTLLVTPIPITPITTPPPALPVHI
jgi:hypothetical protein